MESESWESIVNRNDFIIILLRRSLVLEKIPSTDNMPSILRVKSKRGKLTLMRTTEDNCLLSTG